MIKLINESAANKELSVASLRALANCIEELGSISSLKDIIEDIEDSLSAHNALNAAFEIYDGPNAAPLPDGKSQYMYYNEDLDVTISIVGDIDNHNSLSVFVAVNTENGTYSKEIKYFTDYNRAVYIANKVHAACENSTDSSEVESACIRYEMVKE